MVVDDSALIRNLMTKIINSQSDMETAVVAPDALAARELLKKHNPDVMTLDIEMPKMNGLEFLEQTMRTHPMPVLMVSTMTQTNADITFRALELGAVDFVTKPRLDIGQGMIHCANEITDKIRAAYASRYRLRRLVNKSDAPSVSNPLATNGRFLASEKLILIGSSTGGTEAIRTILEQLPADLPGIVITQHMPPGFTKSFADRLDQTCQIAVRQAQHGERVLPGHAYIAPGDKHLFVAKESGYYVCQLSDLAPVNRHKPSVEVLFKSGAQIAGKQAVGILLTGMGKDGAQAMLEMKNAGSYNFCQDEASSVVFGMPREAIALGAAHEVLPLNLIAKKLMEHLLKTSAKTALRT